MPLHQKVILTFLLLLVFAYVVDVVSDDCSKRTCPAGTKPRIVRYEGCVCVGKPAP